MKFKDFKTLVELNTQDNQSKVPTKFSDWQLIIAQSIKRLADNIELKNLISNDKINDAEYRSIYKAESKDYFLKVPESITSDDSELNIQEDLAMAVVYDVSQMLTPDVSLKQKFIMDKDLVISDYIWNQFTLRELQLCQK